jgi:DNA-binding HxlR family transcriptional regulator
MPNRTFVAARSFNDIPRGVPLISRAVLVARLRELRRSEIEV